MAKRRVRAKKKEDIYLHVLVLPIVVMFTLLLLLGVLLATTAPLVEDELPPDTSTDIGGVSSFNEVLTTLLNDSEIFRSYEIGEFNKIVGRMEDGSWRVYLYSVTAKEGERTEDLRYIVSLGSGRTVETLLDNPVDPHPGPPSLKINLLDRDVTMYEVPADFDTMDVSRLEIFLKEIPEMRIVLGRGAELRSDYYDPSLGRILVYEEPKLGLMTNLLISGGDDGVQLQIVGNYTNLGMGHVFDHDELMSEILSGDFVKTYGKQLTQQRSSLIRDNSMIYWFVSFRRPVAAGPLANQEVLLVKADASNGQILSYDYLFAQSLDSTLMPLYNEAARNSAALAKYLDSYPAADVIYNLHQDQEGRFIQGLYSYHSISRGIVDQSSFLFTVRLEPYSVTDEVWYHERFEASLVE